MNTFILICALGVAYVSCNPAGYGTGGAYGQLNAAGGGGGGGAGSGPAGDQYHNRYQDGSYDFGYNTGTGAFQSERRTSGGQVSGKYGTTNPDGTYVNVEYQGQSTGGGGAGAGNIARYSAEKAGSSFASSGLYSGNSGSYNAPAAPAAPFVSAPARQSYVAPQQAQRYTAPNRPQEYAQFNLERKPDGSYSYNYQSSDSSKTESRSGDGQVQGSYSFRGDDGVQRTVGYSAGQQGFTADGAHLPVTSEGQPAAGTNQGASAYTSGGGSQRYSSSGAKSQGYTYNQPAAAPFTRPQTGTGAYNAGSGAYNSGSGAYNSGSGAYNSGSGAYNSGRSSYSAGSGSYGSSGRSGAYAESGNESPKPFAFNYNAGDHSRQEQADGSGVVRGSYTVNTPDGTYKQITYQADDDGFHVIDEKQGESGGGSSGSSYVAPAATYAAPAVGGGAQLSAYTAGQQTYKPKSIQSPSYYR